MRRTVATVLAVLCCAAPAAAQAPPPPPDERVAAQAFADATARFDATTTDMPEPDIETAAPCPRAIARVPEAREDPLAAIVLAHAMRSVMLQLREPMRQLRTDLANVQTLDAALIRARAAVRQIGRAWAGMPAPRNLCSRLRAWRRAGYPRSAGRAAMRELDRVLGVVTPRIVRRLVAAAERMKELGVPAEQADRFAGDGDSRW